MYLIWNHLGIETWKWTRPVYQHFSRKCNKGWWEFLKGEATGFFTISSLISHDASKCNPSCINKLKRGLSLESLCLACFIIIFWSRTKYWKLESFFPLKPKLQFYKIIVLLFPSEVLQILNWNYIKCELCFSLLDIICMWVTVPTNTHQTH